MTLPLQEVFAVHFICPANCLLRSGYYLSYKPSGGEWSEVSLEYDLLSYRLANLTCGSSYSLNLVAHNVAGRSKPSATLTSPTQGAIPGLPDTSTLVTGILSLVDLSSPRHTIVTVTEYC